jgi:WS/DGAT/MGAT family acyltransferase
MTERLSALDASFLEVESQTAHMHVGWASLFSPPETGMRPSFEALRDHIGRRLGRAPRYRQKLARVPFGLHTPLWVDDPDFDIARHVRRTGATRLEDATDAVMSEPLDRDRPLWELWIADNLDDGRLAVVGKAHHCMVDGIAAVELAALLLDPSPEAEAPEPEDWRPSPVPGTFDRLRGAAADLVRDQLKLAALPTKALGSPERILGTARRTARAARAAVSSAAPAPIAGVFNDPISPYRHLAVVHRPLSDLVEIKRRFGTTLNDVVLAASAGGVRSFLEQRGEPPMRLKTMVPVNVRDGDGDELGNRISFIFVELPCDEPDPVRRLQDVRVGTRAQKEAGHPDGADALLGLVGYAPSLIQRVVGRLVASPRAFNLVVSNIPGPREPLYMLGCELEEAYPVVPLADKHALSIGFTTIRDEACFGLYADREALPDADLIAMDIDDSIDELLECAQGARRAGAAAPLA